MSITEERPIKLVCLVFQGHRGGGKEKEREREKLTQKPHGIFCLFRILGREKNSHSYSKHARIITGCLLFICKECQAVGIVQGRGMRNSSDLFRHTKASAYPSKLQGKYPAPSYLRNRKTANPPSVLHIHTPAHISAKCTEMLLKQQ